MLVTSYGLRLSLSLYGLEAWSMAVLRLFRGGVWWEVMRVLLLKELSGLHGVLVSSHESELLGKIPRLAPPPTMLGTTR